MWRNDARVGGRGGLREGQGRTLIVIHVVFCAAFVLRLATATLATGSHMQVRVMLYESQTRSWPTGAREGLKEGLDAEFECVNICSNFACTTPTGWTFRRVWSNFNHESQKSKIFAVLDRASKSS